MIEWNGLGKQGEVRDNFYFSDKLGILFLVCYTGFTIY